MTYLGRARPASWTSSDIWTAASAPSNGRIPEEIPTSALPPRLLHPPSLLNVVYTRICQPNESRHYHEAAAMAKR